MAENKTGEKSHKLALEAGSEPYLGHQDIIEIWGWAQNPPSSTSLVTTQGSGA